MRTSEIAVLSIFGVLALAGMYAGQGAFVPDEGEKPAQTAARFASHERTFELKASKQACAWALSQPDDVVSVSFSTSNGSDAEGEASPNSVIADDASYHFVISEDCSTSTAAD